MDTTFRDALGQLEDHLLDLDNRISTGDYDGDEERRNLVDLQRGVDQIIPACRRLVARCGDDLECL